MTRLVLVAVALSSMVVLLLCCVGCGAQADESASGERSSGEGPLAPAPPGKVKATMSNPARRFDEPLVCLWQHRHDVDIAPLVEELGFNTVWTDDPPYEGQAWESTHMYRALQVPGIRYLIPKIERIQWGQTHQGSLLHARWVAQLSLEHPEIIGLYLNDFYDEIEDGYRTIEQWREVVAAAKAVNPNLAIWVPHYPHRRNEQRAFDIDYQGVILNIWDPANLVDGEKHLIQAEKQHAGRAILAGVYLNSGARRGHWLTEEEFKGVLQVYVRHVSSGKIAGLRVFCACQLAQRPEYVTWTKEVLADLKGSAQ